MPEKTSVTADTDTPREREESEEFVIPIAPPIPQPGVTRKQPYNREAPPSAKIGESVDRGSGTTSKPTKPSLDHQDDLLLNCRSQNEESSGPTSAQDQDLEEQELDVQPIRNCRNPDDGKSVLIGLILILSLIIVVLLCAFILVGDSNRDQRSPTTQSPLASFSELNEEKNSNQKLRKQLAELQVQSTLLKEEVATLKKAKDDAVTELSQTKFISDRRLAELRAEIASLEGRLHASTAAQIPNAIRPQAPAISQPQMPVAKAEGADYRVCGLRPGDTLNVRSGPGSGYAVVTKLAIGTRVTVTGPAVANDTDQWLPCNLSGTITDAVTSSPRQWITSGWINSTFLEAVN